MKKENIKEQKNKIKGWNFNQPQECELCSLCSCHWNVENKLHWQLDFTFKSDENTTMNKRALFNLQIIKKFALNILNLVKEEYKCSLKK